MTAEPAASPPSRREIDAETHPTRKAVLAAMDRMLRGTPTITRPGLLSKAGLAREAQVDRNHITQGSCRDLGDRLATIAAERQQPATAREAEQQQRIENMTRQLADLTQTHAALRKERDKWQACTQTLLRAIQVLRLENTALQAQNRVLTNQLDTARAAKNTGLYTLPPAT